MGVDQIALLRNCKVASAVRTSLYGLAWISMMFWIVSMDGRSYCPPHCLLASIVVIHVSFKGICIATYGGLPGWPRVVMAPGLRASL